MKSAAFLLEQRKRQIAPAAGSVNRRRETTKRSVTQMSKLFKWVMAAWAIVAHNEALTLCVIIFLVLALLGALIDAAEREKNERREGRNND
jgi:hypothetical protein